MIPYVSVIDKIIIRGCGTSICSDHYYSISNKLGTITITNDNNNDDSYEIDSNDDNHNDTITMIKIMKQ